MGRWDQALWGPSFHRGGIGGISCSAGAPERYCLPFERPGAARQARWHPVHLDRPARPRPPRRRAHTVRERSDALRRHSLIRRGHGGPDAGRVHGVEAGYPRLQPRPRRGLRAVPPVAGVADSRPQRRGRFSVQHAVTGFSLICILVVVFYSLSSDRMLADASALFRGGGTRALRRGPPPPLRGWTAAR